MHNLVNKVWNYASILRDSGVSYTDYVAQLSYLLFLKMDSEAREIGLDSKIDEKYSWEVLRSLSGEELESSYSKTLNELSKQSGIIGQIYQKAANKITEPAKLSRLIALIDGENWLGLGDVKGAIYEGLLQRNATETKAGAGQYFTPRVLIKSIISVMKPRFDMSICDPACGTGGFLIGAYEYMKTQTQDKKALKRLREENLSGVDITPLVVSLCAMNLYLHGLGGEKELVKTGDSLVSLGAERYDMVLTNPPFGKKSSTKIMGEGGNIVVEKGEYAREDFISTTSNKQINFLQHIMSILKMNGKAAVVVPDNVLFEGNAGERVRKRLLSEFDLHTILRLPTGIFYAQGVKANVLFFDKYPPLESGYRTKEVWVYDLRTNVNLSLVTNTLNEGHLSDFEKCYEMRKSGEGAENERFRKFGIDEILKRDKTNLDILWLKDESLEDAENLPTPEILLSEIKANLKSALKVLEEI
ncbi:DNA methyltransferase [Helicobacter sp. 16-1353]|uniref:class I SAM-dependent DNA methyltransferase n=1 Tax=Helicobacter sp. 16-1353 TaxID=2004996 RepID=UPI000DCE8E71|nr:class I SAM-dependent DNA methyltransferase [Helicobacter sp. 16-1353]RAX54637.1 DNA methyltransferase [Helicobacter sp. 16-1353]